MIDILLKDNLNKVLQEMRELREETELLIRENINKINLKKDYLDIEAFDSETLKYLINQGYEIDNSLYESLIIEYNNTNTELLTRWK
jgi:hypothetical protein